MNNPLDWAAIIAGFEDRQAWQLTPGDASFNFSEKENFFKDFNATFGFMGRVAMIAERANQYRQSPFGGQRIRGVALPRLIWKWQRFVIRLQLIEG